MSQNPYAAAGRGPAIGFAPTIARPAHTLSHRPDGAGASEAVGAATSVVTPAYTPGTTLPATQTAAAEPTAQVHTNATTTTTASSKVLVLQRRVRELLDVPVNQELKGLVHYLEVLTPAALGDDTDASTPATATLASPAAATGTEVSRDNGAKSAATAVATLGPGTVGRRTAAANTASITAAPTSSGPVPPTPQALRSVLETRATSIHKEYLDQFAHLYDAFKSASASVQQVHQHATTLSRAVSSQASQTEKLVLQLTTLQTELQLIQQRDEAVREFKHKFSFGAEEQRVLEKDPITPAYLDVLDRARDVHRKSRLLLSARPQAAPLHVANGRPRETSVAESAPHTANAAAMAVMESTYTAITHATVRIARYVNTALSTADASSAPAVWAASSQGTATGASASSASSRQMVAAHGAHSVNSDEPDISVFLLRCVNLLRQEDVPQWEEVMSEVARLRRASVLRQYHHLLATGGRTNTQSGTHRGESHSGGVPAAAAPNARPLEAELDDPLFFFSTVFAWLHQIMVVEKGFMHRVWLAGEQSSATTTASTRLTESTLLGTVFSGVHKQIASALEAALLKLSRTTTTASPYLASATRSSVQSVTGTPSTHTTGAASPSVVSKDGVGYQTLDKAAGRGPRGLTGRLTRLLFLATGDSMQPQHQRGGGSGAADGASPGGRLGNGPQWDMNSAALQRNPRLVPYAAVHTREQQIATASGLLDIVLRTAQTAFALLQLLEYYSLAVFAPLLGADAELTVYIGVTAKDAVGGVLSQTTALLVAHWLDSVSAMVGRQLVLHRLARASSALAMEGAPEGSAAAAAAGTSAKTDQAMTASTTAAAATADSDHTARSSPPRHKTRFVLDYLLAHDDANSAHGDLGANAAVGAGEDGTPYTGNAEQIARRSAFELNHALRELILPCAPEVSLCIDTLAGFVQERAQQETVLAAVEEVTTAHAGERDEHGEAGEKRTARTRARVEEASRQALFLAHALSHFTRFLFADEDAAAAFEGDETTDSALGTRDRRLPQDLATLRDGDIYAPLVHALDDACKAIMCLNTYRSVRQSLSAVQTAMTTTATATASASVSYVLPCVAAQLADMEKSWQRARSTLIALLAESTAQSYFAAFLNLLRLQRSSSESPGDGVGMGSGGGGGSASSRTSMASLAATSLAPASSTARAAGSFGGSSSAFPPALMLRLSEKRVSARRSSGAGESTAQQQQRLEHRLVKEVLAELFDLYNLVAATGGMPAVPLLDAITDDADRTSLARDLLQRVCEQYEEVYEAIKARVSAPTSEAALASKSSSLIGGEAETGAVDDEGRLVLLPGEWAAFADMEPKKLRILAR